MVGKITYVYQPDSWSQDEFLKLGGFTVVFLNYNKSFMIEKSVASALDQDFPLLEMFFMDDASTDGSGDTMEAIVREYRGRHKVSVIRNDENQYITGQWNIVSKLVTGNWLGMFCGDDVSHLDRISCVAKRIEQYPSLKAIATANVNIDPCTNEESSRETNWGATILAEGGMLPNTLVACFSPNGATSFWHKSLFADPLPYVKLDDAYLLFRTFAMYYKISGPFFLYDKSLKTVDYLAGAGVCSQGVRCDENETSRTRRWLSERIRYKKFSRILWETLEKARSLECEKGMLFEAFSGMILRAKIISETTLGRIALMVDVTSFLAKRDVSRESKRDLLRLYVRSFLVEFFGLRFAAFLRFVLSNIVQERG